MDITDFVNTYASFMRLKRSTEQLDIQILCDAKEETDGNGEE